MNVLYTCALYAPVSPTQLRRCDFASCPDECDQTSDKNENGYTLGGVQNVFPALASANALRANELFCAGLLSAGAAVIQFSTLCRRRRRNSDHSYANTDAQHHSLR